MSTKKTKKAPKTATTKAKTPKAEKVSAAKKPPSMAASRVGRPGRKSRSEVTAGDFAGLGSTDRDAPCARVRGFDSRLARLALPVTRERGDRTRLAAPGRGNVYRCSA
jgi:hypothetical protein